MCDKKDNRDTSSVEIADVFRMHASKYCANKQLTPQQYKVIHATQNCRTAILGGHIAECNQCGHTKIAYNSCRNRHCPKCQSLRTNRWLEKRKEELLPVQYFHMVFTLPHELNHLVMYNQKALYGLLFEAAWETIRTLGKDPRRLDGLMGMLSVLHTWGQNLSQHNHVHCIVPGGALINGNQWKHCKKDYLFPVKVVSKIFKGVYVSKLRVLYNANKLKLPAHTNLKILLDEVMKKEWIVYSKKPFAGPEKLLDYLGRYTHKIAISNNRILSCDEHGVTFQWRDYADGGKSKIMTLRPEEFIRRFLSHVVPNGFIRIRSFGFLANACKAKKIKTIREKLSYEPPEAEYTVDTKTLMMKLTGVDISICPSCKKGRMLMTKTLPTKFARTMFDTS